MKSIAVLFILTSHAVMGPSGEPTGLWMEELTTPYYVLSEQGVQIDIASIAGGSIPIDPRSLSDDTAKNPASVNRFQNDASAMEKIKNTPSVANIDLSKYDAVFLPGGHGTMFDLPVSKELATLISQAYQQNKVVAAVCHGPAGLVAATGADGQPIVKGKRVTGFTNSEEQAVGLAAKVPFLLENRLRELGATFVAGKDFDAHAVRDGNLITGQNPASSEEVAYLMLEALKDAQKEP